MEEVTKQLEYFLKHQAFRPDQTTVLFDADLKQTKTMVAQMGPHICKNNSWTDGKLMF